MTARRPPSCRAVWVLWDRLAVLLNVAALARGFRDVLGAEPIVFYQWPGLEPGSGPSPGTSAGETRQYGVYSYINGRH